ncbi:antitoxin VbhA family protein [Zhongshania guokunii]|uniref:Antitoxin VbhA family protein n=1 Tax=Zhongshania guokunii TaxID=641783 RepID=A0ABV3U834_9GAMM
MTKRLSQKSIAFKVEQIIGSMNLSGGSAPPEMRETVRRIVSGELKGNEVRRQLVEKYRNLD